MDCFSHFPAFLFHVNNYPPKSEWTYDDFTNIARLFSCCKHFVTKTAYGALFYPRGSKHRVLPSFGVTKTLQIGLPCPRDGTGCLATGRPLGYSFFWEAAVNSRPKESVRRTSTGGSGRESGILLESVSPGKSRNTFSAPWRKSASIRLP